MMAHQCTVASTSHCLGHFSFRLTYTFEPYKAYNQWCAKKLKAHFSLKNSATLAHTIVRFLARDMLSALYPPVCPTHRWISQKRLKLGFCHFHHTVDTSLSFCGASFISKFWRVPLSEGVKQGWDGKNKRFSSFKRQYLMNGYTPKLLLMANRKSHMRFWLTPRSMTLDDLELLKVQIISDFRVISQIWETTAAKQNRPVLAATEL